jgi:outer membrane lipoprotein carrier protein
MCGNVLAARADEASLYVKQFEKTYRTAKTLRATFQERYIEQGRVQRAESGIAYFRKPGKMRWEYEAPERNLFVVDGKYAWFYVPADHTVTRVPAKRSDDWRTPLALLAGEAKVSRICERVSLDPGAQPADKDLVVLHCKLKQARGDAQSGEALSASDEASSVEFTLVRASGELRKVLIHDRGGVEVEFQFKNWDLNPQVDVKSFRFDPPRSVAIVNGETGSLAAGGAK